MFKKLLLVAAAIIIAFNGVANLTLPRLIVVHSRVGTSAGVQVTIIDGDTPGEQSATTDSNGVASFGRGHWSPLVGSRRVISIKVQRNGVTLLEDLREGSRWGSIRVDIPN